MKLILAAIIVAVVGAMFFAMAWPKVAREEMRAAVAKECLAKGGKYHETMVRRRPVCK